LIAQGESSIFEKMAKLSSNEERDILQRMMKFCAYQERSVAEVKEKLKKLEAPAAMQSKIMSFLVEESFVKEERFVQAFTNGRFKSKKWGKMKIRNELKMRHVADENVEMALEQIDETEYHNTLQTLAIQKNKSVKAETLFERRNKIARFLCAKGYEPDLVWDTLKELFPG
jgi:regulatory protein